MVPIQMQLHRSGLSLIFEVGGDVQKIARDSSCWSEVNIYM